LKSLPILLAAMAFVDPALADPRIATLGYDPSAIALVNGRVGIQSTIAFAPDEHIENVAVGDSASWQVTPNKHANLLFVKPVSATARTNMTVVTDKRTYLFDLVTRTREAPIYSLRFTYPKVVSPPVVATAASPAAANLPPVTPDALNFAWKPSGAKGLLPGRVFDDGRSTWLQWAKDVPLPAILTEGPEGDEGPMNYSVHGDYVVLDSVPGQIILRRGHAVARLTSVRAPDAAVEKRRGADRRGSTSRLPAGTVADARP
jgi:type IV secretion system protein VirB9